MGLVFAEEVGDECGHFQGALAPFGLGVAVGSDGAPHGNVRRDGWVGCWVAVEEVGIAVITASELCARRLRR